MSASLEISLIPNTGGRSEVVSASTTSAQSTVLYPTGSPGYVNVYCASDYFFRMGVAPVAVSTGVDQFVPGGNLVRVGPIPVGFRLAFILLAGTASVYITEES